MVSFQCEGCGDVQTKKKLDSHRNHCHAPFTCIDCMKTFHGTEYRSHTSCMTEDQKYQGHLYREKPTKANKRKSVSILEPSDQNALVPHKPYVEDVLEEDDIPPEVPTPPSAVPAKKTDNVFDYMVEDQPQSTPKIMFTDKKVEQSQEGEMTMKNNAPAVFTRPVSSNSNRSGADHVNDLEYDINGYSYGTQPINPRTRGTTDSAVSLDFMTPAAKTIKSRLDQHREPGSVSHSRTNSGSEKKRKRGQGDEQNGTDTLMQDAPSTIIRSVVDTPGIIHSGLTGGLTRMVTNDEDYPFHRSPSSSPDPDRRITTAKKNAKDSPGSPLKRTRQAKEDSNGLGISIKSRAGKVLSMVGDAMVPAYNADGTVARTRRRTSSSEHAQDKGERRERKKHKVHRHNGTSSANVRHEPRSRRRTSDETADGKKKMKAIEYHPHESNSDSEEGHQNGANGQMVVFGAEEKVRKRCESFLSYVTKGPQSIHGYSVNKALKRWHRDRDVHGTSLKLDEERELWKGLRLKKNDRGEVVVFFEGA